MTLLHLISYLGGLAASGLLWLAELIEEHSRYAKTIGIRAIYGIIALHCLLYFTDGLPFLPILFSALCHLVYLQNFSTSWPYISLTSPKFLLSCALVVGDHFLWFFHFAAKAQEAKKYRQPKYRYGGSSKLAKDDSPAFMDVAAFFAICVWFVPLFLFLSLSANDNALPSFGGRHPVRPSLKTLTLPRHVVRSAVTAAGWLRRRQRHRSDHAGGPVPPVSAAPVANADAAPEIPPESARRSPAATAQQASS
ncbi:hypothetical protein P7C73_g3130, partial [Tremellales sp. Uapishka_1]